MLDDDEVIPLLRIAAKEALNTRYLLKALVRVLVQRGVLKGTEADLLASLEKSAGDLQAEDANQALADERARVFRDSWKKLPPQ